MSAPRAVREVGLDARVELIEGLKAASAKTAPKDSAAALAWKSLPRKHDAVRLFASMTEKDWRHRTPAMIILDFGAPPDFEIVAHKDHYAEAGKDDAISRLLPALRDWAALPAVREYLDALPARHGAAVEKVRARLEDAPYQEAVEAYLGLPLPHNYFFIVSPLARGVNGQNVLYRRPNAPCDIYSLSNLDDALSADPHDFRRTAWHEICHTVVDDWTKAHAALFEPLSGLYALMTGRAKFQYCGPPGWLHIVDEHLIRSTCARLDAGLHGEARGAAGMERERKDGFALIGPVYAALKLYEKSRARYATLKDFYPVVGETLKKIAAAGPAPKTARRR